VAVLTDINPQLINAYHCDRDNLEKLISILEKHQMRHSKDYYYQVRASFGGVTLTRSEGTLVERGARFIYLNKTCFNGLYLENSKGELNVPIGSYKNPKIPSPDLLCSVSVALQAVQIKGRPFDAVLGYAKTAQHFVYFDLLYYPLSHTSSFTAYSRYSFKEDDQIRLTDVFVELTDRRLNV
jgi:DNA adenine methylase